MVGGRKGSVHGADPHHGPLHGLQTVQGGELVQEEERSWFGAGIGLQGPPEAR